MYKPVEASFAPCTGVYLYLTCTKQIRHIILYMDSLFLGAVKYLYIDTLSAVTI